jgi:uncharacterized protein YqgC (DUF456 family)
VLYLWLAILVITNAVWLALVPFALPGNWLIVIATSLVAWWQWEKHPFSIYTLAAIFVLVLLGELVEFLGGIGGARRSGAGFRGSIGAILGAITGAIVGTAFLPFFGTILGSCIGAGIGAWALELTAGRQMAESIHLGFGASVGQFLGTTAKFAIGVTIWLIVAVAAFWP